MSDLATIGRTAQYTAAVWRAAGLALQDFLFARHANIDHLLAAAIDDGRIGQSSRSPPGRRRAGGARVMEARV